MTVSGTAEASARVDLFLAGAPAGSAVASAAGTFSATLAGVPEGVLDVTATATDAAGNTGAAGAVAVTVDRTAPGAPALAALPPLTNRASVTVSGVAEPGASVAIALDGVIVASRVADGAGGFSAAVGGLADGARTVSAAATDAAGNTGEAASATFTVDRTAPGAPLVGTPAQGAPVPAGTVRISGPDAATEPGATVRVVVDGRAPLVTTATATGSWEAEVQVAPGGHTVAVTATDPAGNVSAASTVSFTAVAAIAVVGASGSSGGCGYGGGELSFLALGLVALARVRGRRRVAG